jgi:hypothetical protein
MTKGALPYVELFGHCTRGHRARLVYYDKAGRTQEPYVHMFVMGVPGNGGGNFYRVTCPKCGEEYTTSDRGAELVERKES